MKTSSRSLRVDLARYYRLPSTQVSLGVVLAFVMSALFIMFAIRPTFATIVSLQKEIEDSSKLLKTLETKVSALNQASETLDRIKDKLPLLEKSIPSDGVGYDSVTLALEALAQDTGTSLEGVSLGSSVISSRTTQVYEANKNEEVINTPITIRVKGNYVSNSAFLQRILGAIRLTSIESVTYVRDGAKGNKVSSSSNQAGDLTMTIVGSGYYVANKTAVNKLIPSKGGK